MGNLNHIGCVSADYYFLNNSEVLSKFRSSIWAQNEFEKLFSNYTDRGKMIVSSLFYAVDISGLVRSIGTRPNVLRVGDEYANIFTQQYELIELFDQISSPISSISSYTFNFDNYLNNSFIDYTSITKYGLYIPFVGIIDIEYYMLKNGFTLKYYIDLTSGICSIDLVVDSVVIETFTAPIAETVYYSSGDTAINRDRIIKAGETIASLALSYNSSGASSETVSRKDYSPQRSSTVYSSGKVTEKFTEGHSVSSVTRTSSDKKISPYMASHAVSSLSDLLTMRGAATIRQTSTAGGLYGVDLTPKVICYRPNTPNLDHFAEVEGRPLNEVKKLRDLTGYTEIGNIRLTLPSYSNAFDIEIEEIERLLSEGFYINAH